MYRRLLVPLDGSRLAESVLPLAAELARAWRATVILLHVIERRAPSEIHGDRHLRDVAEAGSYLEAVAGRLRAEGIPVEMHAHPSPEGDVARSIVEHCLEEDADLVILAAHGKDRVRNLFFGRIAQQVLRRGTAPVLMVRANGDTGMPEPGARTVLVPLLDVDGADRALLPALAFARVLHARLRLTAVVPTQETMRGNRQAVSTLLPATTRAALDLEEDEAEERLRALADRLRSQESAVPVETLVCRGDVAGLIATEAARQEVVLTVITTHARSGIQTVWSGSVTSQLLDKMRSPVLLVRPDIDSGALDA